MWKLMHISLNVERVRITRWISGSCKKCNQVYSIQNHVVSSRSLLGFITLQSTVLPILVLLLQGSSHLIPATTCRVSPFYRAWNWGFKTMPDLLKVTQLVIQAGGVFHHTIYSNLKIRQGSVSWTSSDLALTCGSWAYCSPVGLGTLKSHYWYPESS